MKQLIAALGLIALAGCGGSSGNASADANGQAGANQAAPGATATAGGHGGLNIQPGEWEVTSDVQAAQVPNLPAGAHMPAMPPTTIRNCVTAEQVARANASFLTGSSHPGVSCDYSGVSIADGRIQGTSTCTRGETRVTIAMDGSFTPTSYDIHQQMQMNMRGRSTGSTSHLVGRRIGECTANANANAGGGPRQGGQ